MIAGQVVTGYAIDLDRPDAVLIVELLLDGLPIKVARADLYDTSLAATDAGALDPFHGYAFDLEPGLTDTVAVIEVRLANQGQLVGMPLRLPASIRPAGEALQPGWATWAGGLKFTGWTMSTQRRPVPVRGLIDENHVADARPTGWTTTRLGSGDIAVPAFELNLPQRFADGRVHRIELVTDEGTVLPPGALSFVAFKDGLERFLASRSEIASEQLRGRLFDRLIPQSLPFDFVDGWRERFARRPPPDDGPGERGAHGDGQPSVAVILVGETGLEASLDSLQGQGANWTAGVLPLEPDGYGFDPADLLAFLAEEGAAAEVVVFAAGGTVFFDGALAALSAALADPAGPPCAFGDVVADDANGGRVPLASGLFDRERMLEQGYAAWLFAMRRPAAVAAGERGARSLFRMVNSTLLAGDLGASAPRHVAELLGRIAPIDGAAAIAGLKDAARDMLQAQGVSGTAETAPRAGPLQGIRVKRQHARCAVSAVVSVRNGAASLRSCLAGLKQQRSIHQIEIVLVDNDTSEPDALALLAELEAEGFPIVRLPGPASAARSCNAGAAVAHGDYVCFLDQRVVLSTADAIEEMVARCAGDHVAAVGGLLTWPGGAVMDAGLVLTYRTGATKALVGYLDNDAGYAGLLGVARECSAVSSELLLVPRRPYLDLGGMDETAFPLVFHAAAYCLKMRAAGYRIVFTPHARATMTEARDTTVASAEHAARRERELIRLRAAWPDPVNNDPFYAPLLNLDDPLFTALAWPPRPDVAPHHGPAIVTPREQDDNIGNVASLSRHSRLVESTAKFQPKPGAGPETRRRV